MHCKKQLKQITNVFTIVNAAINTWHVTTQPSGLIHTQVHKKHLNIIINQSDTYIKEHK